MYHRRIAALRSKLRDHQLDAFVIAALPNIRYLTGFSGSHAIAVLTRRQLSVVTDSRYKDQIREEVRSARTAVAQRGLLDAIRKLRWIPPRARVGLEADSFSVADLRRLRSLFRGIRFLPTVGQVEGLRAVKDRPEIDVIRQAVGITDRVFDKILSILRPGMRELDLAAEISYWHRRFGAEADAFEPIVAGGPRGAFPHAGATRSRIKKNQLLTIDLGCRFEGYHSDLTRTVAVGNVNRERRKMYQVVLDAQRRAMDAVTAGIHARALDRVARDSITAAGLGKYFSHALGHGVGLSVHELPRVSALSDEVLRMGNVITVEPGVYVPGHGGVRIEDVVVVDRNGPRVLSNSPRSMIVL